MPTARILVVGLFVVIIAILSGIVQDVQDAQAIPAFARKYDFACNVCHVPGFPKLNDFGNVFRDQGYQLGTDGDLPTFEALGKGFWPVSLRTTVGYQVADLRVDGHALTTSGFGFTGLDVLSFGTLARNPSIGGNPSLVNSFGNANPFALGDNQPGIELTGIKRTDLTGGYFRYSLAGLTTNGGSFGDVSGRSAYFYGHVTQSFGGYGIVAGQRIGAFVVAGNAPTQCPASAGGGTVTGRCTDPSVNPSAVPGSTTQGEPFRRYGVDVSLTYGGQWNLFGAWMFGYDSSHLFTGVAGAQNAHWNGGLVG